MEGIDDIIKTTLERLKSLNESESIIGKPIVNGDGTIILPVSRISCGFVAGGGEYNESNPKIKRDDFPSAMAGGGGITVSPVGFLICGKEKKFITVDKTGDSKWMELAKAALNVIKKDEDDE